ncbi:MAG: hypothetical protein E7505_03305 [Ruminococcus sp.]|nr:hypothetical protein [Ruminococcus sp.]
MRRIFRSEDVVKIAEAVRIPDCTVRIQPRTLPESTIVEKSGEDSEKTISDIPEELVSDHTSDDEYDTGETIEEKTINAEEALQALRLELESEREKFLIERDAVLKKAHSEAASILEEAQSQSRKLLDDAAAQADDVLKAAKEKGYMEGVEARKSEIDSFLKSLEQGLGELKTNQEEFFDKYASELRFLALEIAEKIVAQKLECDEKVLFPLVRSAVKTLRDVSWIKVEVSDKLRKVASELEEVLAEAKPSQSIELELRRDADIGTCVVHTAEGVIVASVLTQIENIHNYFGQYKESDENEREA